MQQKNWDKYEVALLIETYQNIKQGRVDRNAALVELSQNLRQMAINEGLEIDDTFRNLNGMQWQLGNLEKAFAGESSEGARYSQLFSEMVILYNDNQEEFQTVLTEAHRKVLYKKEADAVDRKQLFAEWLKQKYSHLRIEAVIRNIDLVSAYALKHHFFKKSCWDVDNCRELNVIREKISSSRIFKLTHGADHRSFVKYGKIYCDFLKEIGEQSIEQTSTNNSAEKARKKNVDIYSKESSVALEEKQPTSIQTLSAGEQVLDLFNVPDLSFTEPISATYKKIDLDARNWKTIYVSLLNLLYR